MNRNQTKFLQVIGLLSLSTILYNNCSLFSDPAKIASAKILPLGSQSVPDSGSDTSEQPSIPTVPYVSGQAKVTISNYNQVLASMLSVTGLGVLPLPIGNTNSPLTLARDTMNDYKNMFSTEGEIELITAPMLLAYISISNSVCQGMVRAENEREPASRTFFGGIDTNQVLDPRETLTDEKVKIIIRKMARAFWGRLETDEERKIILDAFVEMKTEAKATSGAPNISAMVWLCSSMLGSVSSIAN